MIEIWKPIKDYEEHYEVSNTGKVRSYYYGNKPKLIKPYITNKGYFRVGLRKNKIRKGYSIHRLVAETFLIKIDGKEHLNHIDGNKLNNHVSNLEWCTNSENIKHAFDNGLTTEKKVLQFDLKGNLIIEFNSLKEAAEKTKTKKNCISMCCTGYRNRKQANNFIWKFKDI
jgi:hypothetical protein